MTGAGRLPIGELPVDAIFSPVKRVNWEVSSARVGQSTNYDRLTTRNLDGWNDRSGAVVEQCGESLDRSLTASGRDQ
jgi:DNA-directed RNA polymerase subunit alpha